MVASTIMELICSDLKFKDLQYDTQYILLNSKLKDQKKKEKHKEKTVKVRKKAEKKIENKQNKELKSKSKFNEKYSDRIKSIQGCDNVRQRNKEIFEETGSLYNANSKDRDKILSYNERDEKNKQ